MSSDSALWSDDEMKVLLRYAGLAPTEQEIAGLKAAGPQVRRRMLLVREGLRREAEPATVHLWSAHAPRQRGGQR